VTKEPVDKEIEHFRSLDFQVEKYRHEQNMAKVKADKEIALIAQRRRNQMATWTRWVVTPILAVSMLGSAVGVIIIGAKSGPPVSPEVAQINAKKERAIGCGKETDTWGHSDHTWWPDAAGGEGLCLPKEQAPPSK
jgi:hypothetical protein